MARSGDGNAGGSQSGGFNDGSQSGESNNFQGLINYASAPRTPSAPKPPKYDFTADIDSYFDPNGAKSIADALLQQQYSSALLPFQQNMTRGVITPEAFRLAQGNLDQQRSTLSPTYESTALGHLAQGKTALQEALQGYKTDPTSLEVGEGLDFNTALNNSLKGKADEFMGGFNDSLYGILNTQNPFQAMPAQQASLSGQGTSATSSPIAVALANRDNNQGSRRLGDRVV